MHRLALSSLFLLATASPALATWSVIAVDGRTGEVAISSATCVPQERFAGFPAKGLMDVQAIIVPGKGVAAAQAGVDRTRANQKLIYAEIHKGTDPRQIIARLKADPDIETRQFAIVDMQGRMAGFSGQKNNAASLDRQDRVPGTDIYFSVQGNILMSDEVVAAAMEAFKAASGTLADRTMSAMEAADAKGGDKRCTCESEPKVNAACDGKTAHVAYIVSAGKTDAPGSSFNDGRYAMFIDVANTEIKPDENANPVKTLRMRYDAWRKEHGR